MNNQPGHNAMIHGQIPLSRQWIVFFSSLLIVVVAIWCTPRLDWTMGPQIWSQFADWSRTYLPFPNEQNPGNWILGPALFTLVFATALRLLFDRPPDCLRLPVGFGFLSLQVAYLWFRLVATLSLDTPLNATASILFFVSEVFIHFRIALGNLSLLRLTDRKAEADDSQRAVKQGIYLPSVDVFVPTYSEPVEMLRRTIIGCQAIDYPRKTIYLLDDQRRPAMRQLAAELGCEYLDRPDNRHAKAGNLNHALPLTRGELIVCFDADFVPCRNFIQRTVGFFRDETVGMVQTPQNFFNEDAVTQNLGLERSLEDEQRLFFRTLQPGRDAMNAVVCHGSCFVVRRSALEAIGGVPTETITEDWATSIRLQCAGYKILYLNEAMSAGMSADRCGEFVQQRSRWAQGTLQALFASTNPLTVPGLTWKQRVLHFSSIVYYLGSLSSLFNLIAPVLFLFLGAQLLRMTLSEILFYRLPFTVGFYFLYSWLTCGTRSAMWTELYEAFLAPSMAITAIRSLIKPFGTGFRVTDKTIRRQALSINKRVALPFVILFLLHIVGIPFALLAQRHVEEPDAFIISVYFALMNIAVLWLCILISIDVAQDHPFVRFPRQLPVFVTWDDTGLTGETEFLSEGDAVIKLKREISAHALPQDAFLHIPALDLNDVPVQLKDMPTKGCICLKFVKLSLKQRRTLIEYLFCQPGQWNRPPRSEIRAAWEYLRAGLRMYPLAESV